MTKAVDHAAVRYQTVLLRGGLDQVSPSLSLPPGIVRDGVNFEVAPTGGYARVGGYERYDGRLKPSDAFYTIVQVASFTNMPSVGQTITQATSGATGYIIAVGANYMAVTKVTGAFDTMHAITTPGPVAIGTATAPTVAITSVLDAQYTNLAADVYRADITAVPGSGPVRGVVGATFGGVDHVYAFRDNAGGTAVDLYVDSAGGWSQITMPYEVAFTAGGTATPADGATLTQGGVTATIRRVVAASGTWAGTAAGKLVITNIAGGNFAAGAATIFGGATLTLSGAQAQVVIATGGKYEFDSGNFAGQSGSIRIYGCDGANRCFEFDGTTYVPITTGTVGDNPKHIAVHQNALLFSIGSSIFYSGPGLPYRYTQTDGGGEIAVGDTVTGLLVMPGSQSTGTLAVYTISNTQMLYGKSAASWSLVPFNTGAGGIDYTAKNMAQSYVLDNKGVTSLQTTLAYGNFTSATLTATMRPFINLKRSRVTYASLAREKSQYRLFFNDGYGLYITVVNAKFIGGLPVFFPDPVNCVWEGEKKDGTEVAYFGGSSGGFVYQMDVGTSFDGANIDAFITLVWDAVGSSRLLKRFRKASVEIQGNSYVALNFGYELGYSTSEKDQPAQAAYSSGLQGLPRWDGSTVWDQFSWDGRSLIPTEIEVTGSAENIQATIASTTDYIAPYTVNSLIYHYTPRRGLR